MVNSALGVNTAVNLTLEWEVHLTTLHRNQEMFSQTSSITLKFSSPTINN